MTFEDFEKILEENVLWVEKVPAEVRANIIALTDMDGDGFVSQEEFLQFANGRNIPGFNRRRRRAMRELLKQTVEFIVSCLIHNMLGKNLNYYCNKNFCWSFCHTLPKF